MQLKTLLYNRGIFTQNMRNVGWIGIAYFLCLSFALPLQILMITSNTDDYYTFYQFSAENLFRFAGGFQLALLFTVPVLVGIFVFRYMQVKLSADYIHSLPIKRESLFHQNLLFGLFLLLIPVVIITLVLFILSGFIDKTNVLSMTSILKWAGTTMLVNSFVYTATVFVGMYTGISVFQGALTYILFIFPAGVIILLFMNVRYYLYGFAVDYYLNYQIERIVPIVRVAEFLERPMSKLELIIFLSLTIVFYVLALLTYKLRKVETATQAIAFKALQPVFLYGVTVCTMLLGGMYFGETQGTLGWRIFGYISASIIGYYVALMIIEKTWRILTKLKGYFVFIGVMFVVALLIQLDVTGYEKQIPLASEIERVYFGNSIYQMDETRFYLERDNDFAEHYYFEEEENIANIVKLHQEIIHNEDRYNQNTRRYYNQIAIGYQLKNGKNLVRVYQVPEYFYEEQKAIYTSIVNSDEHKFNKNPLLRLNDKTKIDKITIVSQQGSKQVTITDREDLESFHALVQKEIINDPFDEKHDLYPWGYFEYLLDDDRRLSGTWKKTYSEIDAWLDERGILKEARVTADDIEYVLVLKRDVSEKEVYVEHPLNIEEFEREGLKIDDPELIEHCLANSTWDYSGEYVIAYIYKGVNNQYPIYEWIDSISVSESIRRHFQ